MKRYWKLMTLTVFIVVIIGTLFIQASLAKSSLPEFIIEHKNGNPAEVNPLTIIGDYVTDETTYIHTEISDEGTSYRYNESSYLYVLKDDYLQPEMKRLQKDYRNFIRGKHDEHIDSFFEDEKILAYAKLKSEYLSARDGQWKYSFVVNVLDKKTKKSTTFELTIPEDEKYNYLSIQGIQFINDELKIMTVNDLINDNVHFSQEEIHIYTVNLETEKVMSDDVIDVEDNELANNQWFSIYRMNKGGDIGPNKYFVVSVDKYEETVVEDSYDHQVVDNQLMIYNLETNEQENFKLPKEYEEETYPELLSGSIVYFSTGEDDEIEIIGYDLESQQIETEQRFEMPNIGEYLFGQFSLINDKVYIVQQLYEGKADATIVIGDIQTGEILYEGTVELADTSKEQQGKKMHINEIHVIKE